MLRSARSGARLSAALLGVLSLAAPSPAQEPGGITVTGRVTDAQALALPGAAVVVHTNRRWGSSRRRSRIGRGRSTCPTSRPAATCCGWRCWVSRRTRHRCGWGGGRRSSRHPRGGGVLPGGDRLGAHARGGDGVRRRGAGYRAPRDAGPGAVAPQPRRRHLPSPGCHQPRPVRARALRRADRGLRRRDAHVRGGSGAYGLGAESCQPARAAGAARRARPLRADVGVPVR